MKLILTAIVLSLLVACTPQRNSTPGQMIDIQYENGDRKPGEGGVDVGPKGKQPRVFVLNRKTMRPIPGSQLFVSVNFGWDEKASLNGLEIEHHDGSKVTITKATIDGQGTPTLEALKEHLKAKYPDRTYGEIAINGLQGFSAEFKNADGRLESDVYLISETNDFIQVRMSIQHEGLVLFSGQNVLASIQPMKEKEPAKLSMTRRLTLNAGTRSNEVPFEFAQSSATSLRVVGENKKSNYIVRIADMNGSEDFEQITATDDGVIFGSRKVVPVDKINKVYKSDDLELGGIYIVRTENGPFQDMISKVLVESIEPGQSVTLKHENLLPVFIGILINQTPTKRE